MANRATYHWRPNEQSLARESLNAIVSHQKVDTTDVLIREASMGRKAEMGQDWCPSGLATRRLADMPQDKQQLQQTVERTPRGESLLATRPGYATQGGAVGPGDSSPAAVSRESALAALAPPAPYSARSSSLAPRATAAPHS
eukprot:CAMPEP_0168402928 /NCGR_PEP_ID=MMETSP0228-20121227/23867_1 /TAXON_ID=133427 /ORGANISM="Protoceratium reticulatum, Strain CCCM 535 (=CCMP 1889)" /LENGTH=141 /DNA_ID=CAMNT_0008416517 /DNA_START=54 /DNA_END=476 /DNA_ORIENTATION=+